MDSRSYRRTSRGITLLEMVTVMTIVAVLMSIAIPSYRYVTNGNRIAAEVNGLLGDMQYARAEAIKEGQTVTVCVSSNGTSCAGAAVTTWQNGWIVFSDANNDHTVDAGDAILRVQSTFTSTDTFTANNAVGYVTFNREGFASGAGIANGVLIKLHAATANSASTRCLSVTLVGLMTVQTYNQTNNGVTCL
jgi:type IV fimbrial biogenesis protein FimT